MSFLDTLLDSVKSVAPDLVNFIPGVGPVASIALKGVLKGFRADDTESDEQLAERLSQDPELLAKVKMHAMNVQLETEREKTKQQEVVNETMREEAKSGSFMQRSWRPFNGYAFGITLFCDYFLSQIIVAIIEAASSEPLGFTWTHIPQGVYMLWSAVLGITAGSRGFEKISKEKTLRDVGTQKIGEMCKTFIGGAVGQ